MAERIGQLLHDCLHPTRGKPGLVRVSPDEKTARAHLEKARVNLRAMALMYREELFDWTVVCGYYAMYHAVLGALAHIGLRGLSHPCALAAFRKFYVERKRVPPEYVQFLKRAEQLKKRYAETLEAARENRIVVQYGIEEVTNDDAEWLLEEAKTFVLRIEEVLA
ncbi:MAG: HEPN domain-containing protein [Candidatus Omnitrophota bacterium]|nr:HEPN domain-containing protein [Candidatus Omnitrophota bacterium]